MYKLSTDENVIIRLSDNASIPKENPQYTAYLDWLEEGNTPEPEFTEEDIVAERMGKSVTMRQARLALLQAGLLPQIEVAIEGLSEPDKTAVKIEWEYALDVKRSHTWVIALTQQLGMTDQQLDDLFVLAETF